MFGSLSVALGIVRTELQHFTLLVFPVRLLAHFPTVITEVFVVSLRLDSRMPGQNRDIDKDRFLSKLLLTTIHGSSPILLDTVKQTVVKPR